MYDHLFKVLLIGDAGVGKSSLLLRFTRTPGAAASSGEDGRGGRCVVAASPGAAPAGGKTIKLTLWDTAGARGAPAPRARSAAARGATRAGPQARAVPGLTSSYYRGAQGIILVYDVTRRETFDNLQQWLREVEVYTPGGGSEVVKLLVGNKVDCDAVVPRAEAADWGALA
ncbi:Rab18 family GTPase [Aureococcus anophagefferens]|nr:Rab18 family GTPase [Aureococcus anophagefferens]